MDLAFDIFPAATPRGTRLVRLTSEQLLPGSIFRKELGGIGGGRIVINAHQAEATPANFARDNYVEVFDLNLSGAYSLGAFFLEEGDFEAVSRDEQAGRILSFSGSGELGYLSRGILGTQALSGAQGPFDQHYIDTTGQWDWGSDPATETYGAILRRIIYESALMTPDPLPEVQLVDITWDDLVDSNGDAWAPFLGRYTIPVGENLLAAVADLLKHGIELIANADFEYSAYNTGGYGTDRTSATFATNKVRFQAGTNIAADLKRAVHGAAEASHAIVVDKTGALFETVVAPGYSGGDTVRYVGLRASGDSQSPDDLELLGTTVLTNRATYVDQFRFPHPPGYTPLSGLYTPGPPVSAGHYWIGDYVTIHTGSGPHDANERTIRVAAIEWSADDAGNWLPTVELGSKYLSASAASLDARMASLVTAGHTHPPNPELCRPGLPFAPVGSMGSDDSTDGANHDSVVVADAKVEWVGMATTRQATVGQSIVVITGSQDNANTTGVWDDAGNTYVQAANHGDPGGGAPFPRVSVWYSNVTTTLPVGDHIHYEVGVGSSLLGSLERGGKTISAYLFNGTLSSPAESGTNGAVNTASPSVAVGGGSLIVAAGEENGGATGFPDTITLDPDWTAFDGAATVASGSDGSQIWGGFRVGDTGGETYNATIDQARDWAMVGATFSTDPPSEGDLPADVGATDAAAVGTSVRAARCDHVHEHPSLTTGGPYHAASDVTVTDSGSHFTATDVEGALAEIAAAGATALTVKEIDGTPSVSPVTTIRVTNGALTDDGSGQVTIVTSGSGGVGWTQDISQSGSSIAGWTAQGGTWAVSGGTVLANTDAAAAHKRLRYNTKHPWGLPSIYECEVQIISGGGLAGMIIGYNGATATGGLAVAIADTANKISIEAPAAVGEVANYATTIATSTWYKLRVIAGSVMVSVYLDGTLLGSVAPATMSGASAPWDYFALFCHTASAQFRNIKAWTLSSGLPA